MPATVHPQRPALPSLFAAAALAAVIAQAPAQAALTYSLAIDDPLGAATSFYSQIDSHVGAALFHWGNHLAGSANLEVSVEITSAVDRAAGASFTSGFVGSSGGYNVWEQGVAYELRTGSDPNGALPDVRFLFNADYLSNVLWFDSNPYSRTAAVAGGRVDAASVFIHEFGHALAFNGWGDLNDGSLPANYASPWDMNTRLEGGTLFFTGAQAQAVYGGPVPLTMGNNFHLGNGVGPGSDLVGDVMNGVVFDYGRRYNVSALNLAMLQDMGVGVLDDPLRMHYLSATAVPEPETWALWLGGLALLGSLSRRRLTR